MSLIQLTQGLCAIVDDQDASALALIAWHAKVNRGSKTPYAYRNIYLIRGGKRVQRSQSMHWWLWGLWGLPVPDEIDHKNRNGLDNRRDNLRAATRSLNMANSGGPNANNKSGFRGVAAHAGKWDAYITVAQKRRFLGQFNTPEAAARVRDAWALEAFGEFAWTNFDPMLEA